MEPVNQLAVVVAECGLELESAQSLKLAFAPLFDQAEEWRKRVATIKVTDVSQVREMKLARESRLALKEIRVKAGKMRKALKEDSLRRGKAIDGCYNVLEFLIAPLEQTLLEQEQFAVRKEEERKVALKVAREQALAPYGVDTSFYQLGEMPDDTFNQLLSNTKIAHEAMREAAIRAEQERIAREKAEADERERVRLENERLRREAAERVEAARIERDKAEKAQQMREAALEDIQGIQHQVIIARMGRVGVREGGTIQCIRETLAETEAWPIDSDNFGSLTSTAQSTKESAVEAIRGLLDAAIKEAELQAERARVAKEQAEAAAKAAREKKAIEAKARAAKLAAEAAAAEAARVAAENAKRERDEIEAKAQEAAEKARKEREAIEARAKAEREVLEAKAREAEAAQRKAEREAQEVRDAEARRIAAEVEAKRRAALAPEREKLLAFAKAVRALEVPFRIVDDVAEFVARIEAIAERIVSSSK